MKNTEAANWTRQEFQTYFYIYCMNADYKENKGRVRNSFIKN